jgi:hypothetical protein
MLKLVPEFQGFTEHTSMTAVALLCAPLFVTARLVVTALYFHVLIVLSRSNKQPPAGTFRVVCYAQSTAIFKLIPLFGSIIAPLWSLYLLAVGFSKIHKVSIFKAFILILLPLIIMIIVCGGILLVMLEMGFAMNSGFGNLFSLFRM